MDKDEFDGMQAAESRPNSLQAGLLSLESDSLLLKPNSLHPSVMSLYPSGAMLHRDDLSAAPPFRPSELSIPLVSLSLHNGLATHLHDPDASPLNSPEMSHGAHSEYSPERSGSGEFESRCEDRWFDSREALLSGAQTFARENGFAVVIRSSTDRHVYLSCDRSGQRRDRRPGSPRVRDTGTRLIGCEFQMRGLRQDGRWLLATLQPRHNHLPSIHASMHPVHRRLTGQQTQLLNEMLEQKQQPRTILASMRAHGALITSRDVYNYKAAHKRNSKLKLATTAN